MIELTHIYKRYERTVLDDINLVLYPGRIYVLNGTSGSGKSSLFHILGGLDTTYEGEVKYLGKALKDMNKAEIKAYRDSVGYVFQESLLIPQFNVLENLKMFCADQDQIHKLIRAFDLEDILQSNPVNLSNGERQRIAIIRTLLHQPSILLMDEPTASLDPSNARILLQQIVKLKSEDRILMISTHDPIFQEIADVVLQLEYGNLTQTSTKKAKEITITTKSKMTLSAIPKHRSFDLLYSLRKYKGTFKNIGFLLSASLLFLLLFLSFTFKMNFQEAYEQKLKEEYPSQTFSINKKKLDKLNDPSFEMQSFKNYQKEYDEFSILSYFPKEDSSLSIPQAIEFGAFPSSESEVVVNSEYVETMFPNETVDSLLQKEIIIEGNSYPIAGILTTKKGILKDVMSSNTYYWDISGPLVFMSEPALETIVDAKDDPVVMAKLLNKEMNSDNYTELFNLGVNSYFYRVLQDKVYRVNLIFYLIQACLLLLAIISFIFLYFVIQLDLFHRKRELGYLQILHVHKKRVSNIIRIDYLLKVIPSLLLSLFLYSISIVLIKHYFNFALPYDFPMVSLLLLLIIFYTLLVVEVPLRKYMKKDILFLIKDS